MLRNSERIGKDLHYSWHLYALLTFWALHAERLLGSNGGLQRSISGFYMLKGYLVYIGSTGAATDVAAFRFYPPLTASVPNTTYPRYSWTAGHNYWSRWLSSFCGQARKLRPRSQQSTYKTALVGLNEMDSEGCFCDTTCRNVAIAQSTLCVKAYHFVQYLHIRLYQDYVRV